MTSKDIEKFSTSVTIAPVNYIGEASRDYLLRAMLGNRTAAAGVRFIDNVKFKINLKKLVGSSLLVPQTCDENFNGSITASADQYEVYPVQSVVRVCWEDMVQLFGSQNLTAGTEKGNVNQITDFSTGLIDMLVGKIGESVDNMLWNGKKSTGGTVQDMFDGFKVILKSNGGNNLTGTTITAGNVVSIFAKVYAAQIAQVIGKPVDELVFFCNAKTKALLMQAYSLFINISPIGSILSQYMGIEVAVIPAIGDNEVYFGAKENFVILTDLYADTNSVSVLDERPRWNFVLFILRAKLAAAIGWTAEIVTYGII